MTEDIMKGGLIMLHPERRKIIELLKERNTALFIGDIADKTGIERRLVSYHLNTLQENGFAQSEFKVIEPPHSRGKAGRFYSLTPKVDEVMGEFIKKISATKEP